MSFSPHPLLGHTLSEFWTHSCRLSPAEALLAAASDLWSCKHGLARDGPACPWASVMALPRRACVHVLRVMRVASGLHIATWSCTWGQRTSCSLLRPQGLSGLFQGPGYFQREDRLELKNPRRTWKSLTGARAQGHLAGRARSTSTEQVPTSLGSAAASVQGPSLASLLETLDPLIPTTYLLLSPGPWVLLIPGTGPTLPGGTRCEGTAGPARAR